MKKMTTKEQRFPKKWNYVHQLKLLASSLVSIQLNGLHSILGSNLSDGWLPHLLGLQSGLVVGFLDSFKLPSH